jgi:hypothetical protein
MDKKGGSDNLKQWHGTLRVKASTTNVKLNIMFVVTYKSWVSVTQKWFDLLGLTPCHWQTPLKL